jgi:predicted ATPase
MRQLLTESEAQIQVWKNNILEAVGENGQVIVEVIPELVRIIGQQPPAPELLIISEIYSSLYECRTSFSDVFR